MSPLAMTSGRLTITYGVTDTGLHLHRPRVALTPHGLASKSPHNTYSKVQYKLRSIAITKMSQTESMGPREWAHVRSCSRAGEKSATYIYLSRCIWSIEFYCSDRDDGLPKDTQQTCMDACFRGSSAVDCTDSLNLRRMRTQTRQIRPNGHRA
jgi:hypothetical protein